jgi:hypothetical protein
VRAWRSQRLFVKWSGSVGEFIETMRTGVDPYGNILQPAVMPWQNYADAFTDEKLEAIYAYVRSLPMRADAPVQ